MRGRVRTGVVAIAALVLLTACGSGVAVDAYPTEPGTDLNCKALLADVPPIVADLPVRQVDDDLAAAWGEPLIVLRCGVEKPDGLTPASRCNDVAGVGWYSEPTSDGVLFTTIGRTFFVSVEIPSDHDPAADALVDLAPTVEKHDPVEQPCV